MGDSFQTIADVRATAEEADSLAVTTLAWLVDNGIVLAKPTDCVLGSDLGYPPGPRYTTAVTEPYPGLLTSRFNGVELVTGKTVFYSMGADHITCPHCRQVTDLADERGNPNEAWRELADTIDSWLVGGPGQHPCRNCGRLIDLNDWTWSPPWGFGYFGIEFWNWPPLSPQFLAETARRLGHRTVRAYGKI